MGQKRIVFIAVACVLSISTALRVYSKETAVDRELAVQEESMKLAFWYHYNDAQKKYLNQLIQEYNDTEGAERHVTTETYSQGSIGDLTSKIDLVLNGSINDMEMANMSLVYRDMVMDVVRSNNEKLVDVEEYLTEGELAQYSQVYLEEEYIRDRLCIPPLVKSMELSLMNQTRLDEFSEANPQYSVLGMADWDNPEEVAEGYYEWTGDTTPNQEEDGSPFIGSDNLANYFITMNHAIGSDIYHYDQGGRLVIDLEEEYVKRLFLNYYIPFIKGYYGASGRYKSDDLKQSIPTGYIDSSSNVFYFPDEAAGVNEDMVSIEMGVHGYPVLSGCKGTAIQQGAGAVVFNRGGEESRASMDLIHWLTVDRGSELASPTLYMPVSDELITQKQKDLVESPGVLEGLEMRFEQSNTRRMVYGFDFENSYDVRTELDDCLSIVFNQGCREFLDPVNGGMTPEGVAESMDYDGRVKPFYEQVREIFGQ